jgi:hypothetical protein
MALILARKTGYTRGMRTTLAVAALAALSLCACRKKIIAEQPAAPAADASNPASVPISNDPRNGAAMISAAQRAAAAAGASDAKREDGAKGALGGE